MEPLKEEKKFDFFKTILPTKQVNSIKNSKYLIYFHILLVAWATGAIVYAYQKGLPSWTIALNIAVIAFELRNIKKFMDKK